MHATNPNPKKGPLQYELVPVLYVIPLFPSCCTRHIPAVLCMLNFNILFLLLLSCPLSFNLTSHKFTLPYSKSSTAL